MALRKKARRRPAVRRLVFYLSVCFLLLAAGVPNLKAQDGFFPAFSELGDSRGTGIKGYLDWDKGTISATVELNLSSVGIRLPTGRIRAEEILEDEYFRLLRPYLFSLQADSSSTVYDLIRRGELSLEQFDRIEREIQKVPPSFNSVLSSITARYTLPIGSISAFLSGAGQTAVRYGPALRLPFIPSPAADYTGIIIIADAELPIHGRKTAALLKPCLFPKIWDTEMNLIYDGNISAGFLSGAAAAQSMAVYTPLENIFRSTPTGLDSRLAEVAGTNPLRIIARGVYGINPTDPVIDREDSLLILSSDHNRRLLSENRIIIAVNSSVLSLPFEQKSITPP